MNRISPLDGLRGLAALTVLFHHAALVFPSLAAPHFAGAEVPDVGSPQWWLVVTPLHVFWEGKSGVYIFFVLSGFVLTLPAVAGRGYVWRSYYPSRLLRLYLPIWGAVAFAALTFFIVPRVGQVDSQWLDRRPTRISPEMLAKDLTLVAENGGIASPLWSLQWEILFSLALPPIIWAALRLRRLHAIIVVASIALSTFGGVVDEPWYIYPPMFVVGVVLAMRREEIVRARRRLRPWGWAAVIGFAAVASTSRWILFAVGAPQAIIDGSVGLILVGSCLFVISAFASPAMASLLDVKPLRVLGLLSFSLYLVHEPIMVAAGYALPDDPLLAVIVAVTVTAVVTPLFYLLIERPAHRLSKAVATRLRPSGRPRPRPRPAPEESSVSNGTR